MNSAADSHAAASHLVLSLFPGAGLLDRGFELAGFVVVRGPDTLWGQDIRYFHPPASHFAGVIGGSPCQDFSRKRRAPPTGYGVMMLREFARCVTEARPSWFLLENVPGVPSLVIHGYTVQRFNVVAGDFGSRQRRNRTFQFGSLDGVPITLQRETVSHCGRRPAAVLAKGERRKFSDLAAMQGLPRGFRLEGLTPGIARRLVGNGVHVGTAKAVAVAIRDRSDTPARLCACGCGRPLNGNDRQVTATAACRKRIERSRKGIVPRAVTLDGTEFAASRP